MRIARYNIHIILNDIGEFMPWHWIGKVSFQRNCTNPYFPFAAHTRMDVASVV